MSPHLRFDRGASSGPAAAPARARGLAAGLALLAAMAAAAAGPAAAAAATTRLVSVGPGGVQGNADSGGGVAVSADGRFVAFGSYASNLAAGDSNGVSDVFVRDRQAGVTELVSVGQGGVRGNGFSDYPAISADGRYVAFLSGASNLVPGDTNGVVDLFVRDRRARRTVRASVATGGAQADAEARFPAISPGGRYVAFSSFAANLTPGDANGTVDVFLRDLATGRTERVAVGLGGAVANGFSDFPSISAEGRFVAFTSRAGNLVPGDTNGRNDVFVRDRVAGTTTRVRGTAGAEGAVISADGRFVAYTLDSDVFLRDRQAGTTVKVSVARDGGRANGDSYLASLAPGGRHVGFVSRAANLVPGDTNGNIDTDGGWDAFVRDVAAGRTVRVSVAADGAQVVAPTFGVAVSAGGRVAAFTNPSDGLVPGDGNRAEDVFVRVR